ncbi:hypothetical protein SAMD00019534_078910 [Acytostelium subglobosum LB1]|uniref:hypothetical protein n=1 Tax=Acytostelium subglobosum LB1 TaxID=1410327 RepID=UPI0006449357|nr:hypothetical protein SAMD00019534_078910 [Acytostelium subglobosum LB1]GAM24716.1 hypothetical protein SAMD00019534_078910 [Acytostelium subglobosum LB1]|eukprot:XP_012752385.1 hypothetical protein SAMD00019534_078910 [Acytostelium subglobosum LB1]
MKIAIEGCCHGEIETIYNSLVNIEHKTGQKVDLLLMCGDYEALRNPADLGSMAVPDKYKTLGSFHHYYSGRLVAPVLTLVIGGNHEASNYFSELPNGGWLCKNIYYMGRSGVVTFGGLRIAGISGIYKEHDYQKGLYERVPLDHSTMRSIYHVRELDVFKLLNMQETPRLDIVFSHDWPQGIVKYGDRRKLEQFKQHLLSEGDELGNPAATQLMCQLRPKYWFSGHLHVKYAAVYPHAHRPEDGAEQLVTKFLALDKVLPGRDFIQVIDVVQTGPLQLSYDPHWLGILNKCRQITNTHTSSYKTPLSRQQFQQQCTPNKEECDKINNRMMDIFKMRLQHTGAAAAPVAPSADDGQSAPHLEIPFNFIQNVMPFDPAQPHARYMPPYPNPQHIVMNNLLEILGSEQAIDASSLQMLDTETFRMDMTMPMPNNQQQQSAFKVQKLEQSDNVKTYKDSAEIDIDDIEDKDNQGEGQDEGQGEVDDDVQAGQEEESNNLAAG